MSVMWLDVVLELSSNNDDLIDQTSLMKKSIFYLTTNHSGDFVLTGW